MKGDFTRTVFKAERNYSGVHLQQGRVGLDSDDSEAEATEAIERHFKCLHAVRRLLEAIDGKRDEVIRDELFAPEILIRSATGETWSGQDVGMQWVATNVVMATDGKTVAAEVLGSGGASGDGALVTISPAPVRYQIHNDRFVRIEAFRDPNRALRSIGLRRLSIVVGENHSTQVRFVDGGRGALPREGVVVSTMYRTAGGVVGNVRPASLVVLDDRDRSWRARCMLIAAAVGALLARLWRRDG